MKINNFLLLLIAGVFISAKLFSQQSMGGVPLSIKNNISSVGFPKITLASINNETEMARADSIKEMTCSECENNYYGRGIDISIDIKNDGQMFELEDSSKLWLLKVESATAFGLQFYFNKFKIPEMATLFIRNVDSSVFLGAFTSDNNPVDTTQEIKFGTQPIKGNSVIIEYWEPKINDFEGELQITKLIHIFNNIIWEGGPFATDGGALPCNINVSCSLGSGWQNEINSVVLILGYDANTELTAQCSGAIINNTDEDGRVLLLTANHCIDGTGPTFNYSNWTFLFNHQTTTCGSDGSDVSSYTGQSVYGSALLTGDGIGSPNSDYLLLDLNASKETMISYGVCYAGWTLNTNPTGPFIGIHHPAGDVKKISNATVIDNYSSTHWRVDWAEGTTQGGSSGSPLFNNDHKIIGQVHYGVKPAGSDDCDPAKVTGYGKFSESWTQSGATGFAFYLDPYSTGQTSVNVYCPIDSSSNNPSSGSFPEPPCPKLISEGMTINGSWHPSSIPCVDLPIVLKPAASVSSTCPPLWKIPVTIKDYKCDEQPTDANCSIRIFKPSMCRCKYVEIFLEVVEVNENLYPIGNVYSKWIIDPIFSLNQEGGPGSYASAFQITVDQYKLGILGVSLLPNKTYRLKLAANQNGWKETTRYFRIAPSDIYLANLNLTSDFPSTSFPPEPDPDPLHPNFFLPSVTGRNITLDDITTVNYDAPPTNNITIAATKSITITNSVITANFTAMIVDDECAVARMANPNTSTSTNNSGTKTKGGVAEQQTQTASKSTVNSELQTLNSQLFSLYPNPTSGTLQMDYRLQENETGELIIYDITGRKVKRFLLTNQNNTLKIQEPELKNGVYLYQIIVNNEMRVSEKLVVIK